MTPLRVGCLLLPIGLALGWGILYWMFIWQGGLDFHNPASARDWIRVCARGREDVYCKAAHRVMKDVQEPVVFLHPNAGDREITAALRSWKGGMPTQKELDAVARANLLRGRALRSGTMSSLDGQARRVVCPLPDKPAACRVGYVEVWRRNQPQTSEDGAVYATVGSGRGLNFFLPPDGLR
ncbi:hypothetical protein QOL99_12910 [Deinococcus sp. MIMF12]|uniref:Uncharacterized protein n=1 Tax=Deinococcus rhizophilus TaxID=3049544 RepID=A0ABT7JJ09_9DEIO|nr:hypothetical protein [Deinococcus rhizophilus]MDL2345045.1 hypothetical protein [Deinococcus rhizophilus]